MRTLSPITLLDMRIQFLKISNEVGDLETVPGCPACIASQTKDNSVQQFETEEGWKVEVQINPLSEWQFQHMAIPTPRMNSVHIDYVVERGQSQYSKTTYSKLVRILKTVSDIVLEYGKTHPDMEAFVFLASTKDRKKLLMKSDEQLNVIYKTIMIKRIIQGLAWHLKDLNLSGEDFVIYKRFSK